MWFVKRFSQTFFIFYFGMAKVGTSNCRLGFIPNPLACYKHHCTRIRIDSRRLPLDVYIIPHFCGFVKRFFKTFWKTFKSFHLFLSLDCIYYTTFRGICQEVFEKFFKNFLELRWLWLMSAKAFPLLTDNIIPQNTQNVNRQNTQNREKILMKICWNCLLTNCVGCGII